MDLKNGSWFRCRKLVIKEMQDGIVVKRTDGDQLCCLPPVTSWVTVCSLSVSFSSSGKKWYFSQKGIKNKRDGEFPLWFRRLKTNWWPWGFGFNPWPHSVGLRIWRYRELWCRLQMCLRCHVAMAVIQAGSCSSDLTPSLGTSVCLRCGPKKKKKKKKGRSYKARSSA